MRTSTVFAMFAAIGAVLLIVALLLDVWPMAVSSIVTSVVFGLLAIHSRLFLDS